MKKTLSLVLQLFLRSARLQKKRATLTIAALAWGTVTILLLLAFGEGLKRQMMTNEQAMGNNLAILWPGETTMPYKGLPPGHSIRPRIEDVDFARERMPELDAIWAELTSWRTALAYGKKTVNGRVIGTIADYGVARKHFPKPGGRFLNPDDENEKRRVVFLGTEMAKDLFGEEEPVGKTLLINNSPFTVIGVMQRKRQSSTYGGPDAQHAVIPQSTFKAVLGNDRVNVVVFRVKKSADMDAALVRFSQILGPRLGFDPEDSHAFGVWNTVEGQKMSEKIFIGLEMFFGIIGGADAHHRRRRRGEHHVRRRQGKHQGDRRQDGSRRPQRVDHRAFRARRARLHVPRRTLRGAHLDRHRDGARASSSSRATTSSSSSATPRCRGRSARRRSCILGLCGLAAGYFPARRAAAIDPASTLRYE